MKLSVLANLYGSKPLDEALKIISSLGVGVSLAVQGSLSNFAGGLVILVMKPFKLGDFITAQGCSGTVEEIKMFYTYVVTPDNKVQMIPNGVLANDVIVNVSAKEDRRVDLEFSVAYGENTTKVKEIIAEFGGKYLELADIS